MSRRRRGQGSLVAALALLALVGLMAGFYFGLSRQTLSASQASQLQALARMQARSALEELRHGIVSRLETPGDPVFELVRGNMNQPWTQLDLTPLLPRPAVRLLPAWGRRGPQDEAHEFAQGEVLLHEAVLRAPRSAPDPLGSEEWVGLLHLRVQVSMSSLHGALAREASAAYEVRGLRIAPPRPFDQLGLLVGDLDAVTDRARVADERRRLIADHEALRAELIGLQARHPGEVAARLGSYLAGMKGRAELEARLPRIPVDEPVALSGFHHLTDPFRLTGLDLAGALERRRSTRQEALTRMRAAAADPVRVLPAAYQALVALTRPFDRLRSYHYATRVLPHSEATHREAVAPYLHRLTPEHFLARAHLRAQVDDPLVDAWRTGEQALVGVLDLTGGERPLELQGEVPGRVVLLVGPGRTTLRDLNIGTKHRLLVVSLGGDIEVRGEVQAAIVMLGTPGAEPPRPGVLTIPPDALLHGGLLLPVSARRHLQLEGRLSFDPGLTAAFPPERALGADQAAAYATVVAPAPLFRKGRRL